MNATPGALAGLRQRVGAYYTDRIARHGPTPEGVDWTCAPTQELRFVQLLKVCDFAAPFSLNDFGCGYGALVGFIRRRHRGARVDYLGIDLSEAMVGAAQRLWAKQPHARFEVGEACPRVADYAVASGIFNVRLDEPLPAWEAFVADALRGLARASRAGFAVNFLAPLPPGMEGKPQLYRCAAARWADFCERELGLRVEVLDRYGMREFTLLARH